MNIAQDVRYALRLLRQSPVFTAVAVGSLALGIGANTAIFTLVNAVLLRWLPVQNPQELVVLARDPSSPSTGFNYPDYRYIQEHNQSYAGVIAFSNGGRPTSFRQSGKSDSTELVSMSMVTGNYFKVLGVTPALGRLFNPADNEKEGAHPYVVLSYGFWTRSFARATDVIGRDVLLNGARFQVVGVSREGFTGPSVGVSPDVFVPIMMNRTFNPLATNWNSRHYWFLTAMGRLRSGVTMQAAGAEMDILWHRILQNDPDHRPPAAWDKHAQLDNTGLVLPGSTGYSYMRRETSRPLVILMITVAVVLLIACANVASLLLARAAARQREIAVRLALGAKRGRLVMQLLTESLTLSLLGGVAGIIVAWAGVQALLQFFPKTAFGVQLNLRPDAPVLGFSLGLCILTSLIFGLAPALQVSRPDLIPALKSESGATEQGRGRGWSLQRMLVALQVALSLILLAGAGLFVRTLGKLRDIDPGINRQNLLFVSTNLSQLGYQPQHGRNFKEQLRERVQRIPGVMVASFANITPLSGSRWNNDIQVEGYHWRPDDPPFVDMNGVSPRYFETAGIPVVLGRDFRDSDNAPVLPDRPNPLANPGIPQTDVPGPRRVVIVNDAFARKFFAGQSPIGKRLCFGEKWDSAKAAEIVGMVADARYFDLKKNVEPMIYQPAYREAFGEGGDLCVRTASDPNRLIASIRQLMGNIDGAVVITESHTMEDNMNRTLAQERVIAMLGGFFGLVSLLLASVGLYGVMSYTVTRRTREIGIRMALGAEAGSVLWLVLRDVALTILVGATVGAGATLLLTRYTESMLFGVKPNDPVTFVGAFAVLLSVTAFAGFLPAYRATRVEPLEALRDE